MTFCHGIVVVAEQIVFRATLDGYSVAIAVECATVGLLGLDNGARHCGRGGIDSFGRGVKEVQWCTSWVGTKSTV